MTGRADGPRGPGTFVFETPRAHGITPSDSTTAAVRPMGRRAGHGEFLSQTRLPTVELSAMLRALIFDFDGMIADTETPEFTSWQNVFQAHRCDLQPLDWVHGIGTHKALDPYRLLEERSGLRLDRSEIASHQKGLLEEMLHSIQPCAGVVTLIEEARRRGLKVAVASSSSRRWVKRWLDHFGLSVHFDVWSNRDDVAKVKPDPALYRHALAQLGLASWEVVAFEDSLNGLKAARAAGLFTVVVPNAMTRHLALEEADLLLDSLEEFSLERAIQGALAWQPPAFGSPP